MPMLGGVRPPIASLVVLLLMVAALTVIGLDGIHTAGVPQAVLNGEQQIAADTALSMRSAIDAEASAVRRTADAYPATSASTPTTTLKALTAARKAALGSALLDQRNGKLLAAGGKTVPLTGVDVARTASGPEAIPPRLVTSGGTRQLLYFAKATLPAQQDDPDQDQYQAPSRTDRQLLLVVSEALPALTAYGEGRTAEVLDASGKALATAVRGTASETAAHSGLSAVAARAANGSRSGTDASGTLLGTTTGSRRTVAGWAQVASATGSGATDDLGLVVLTSRAAPATTPAADYSRFALETAGTLAMVALLLGLALYFSVQQPLLRLYLSAGRLARGVTGVGRPRRRSCPGRFRCTDSVNWPGSDGHWTHCAGNCSARAARSSSRPGAGRATGLWPWSAWWWWPAGRCR